MRSIHDVYKVGRGPSSSHTMGPARAAALFREETPEADAYRAVLYGSLSKTGKGHGTDRILEETFAPLPAEIVFSRETVEKHPNTLDLTALRDGQAPSELPRTPEDIHREVAAVVSECLSR